MAYEQIGRGILKAIGVVEIQDAPDLSCSALGIRLANGLAGYAVDLTLEEPIAEDDFLCILSRLDNAGLCFAEWQDESTVRITSTDTAGDPAPGNIAFEIMSAQLQTPPVTGP